jgi:aryl-alcohol dehydrogenase-like predicted oxidoreductase
MRRRIGSREVFAVGLGGMPMSIAGRPTEARSRATIHAALDAGVELIDTADVYCKDHTEIGHNERLIASVLKERADRANLLVATKGGLERPAGAWTSNGHPAHLKKACEASLKALGVERIDLYQLHAPDEDVPLADSVGALAALQAQGKIGMVGLSNVTVAEIEEARTIVDVVSVQNRCGPFDRTAWDDGVLPLCEKHGIAFLPWGPMGGKRGKQTVARDEALITVGRNHGISPFQTVIAWLLAKSPVMIPIPGASRPENATDSAGAAGIKLLPRDLAILDRVFPIS